MRAHPAGPLHGEFHLPTAPTAEPPQLNELDLKVWPQSATRGDDGGIRIGGCDVRALAAEHGTPLYVIDEQDFRARARVWHEVFGGVANVSYAGKAFLCGEVARWLADEGMGLDVCSGGELAVALAANFPAEHITFHGNNKSISELRMALQAGVGRIVADSTIELDRLESIAAEMGVRPRVLVRVTVGVEAHTHEFIATAHEDQKFGFSLATGAAAEAARRVIASGHLRFGGLHSHIGSQIFDTSGFEVSAHRLVGLAAELAHRDGVMPPELNLGGGLGIAYTSTDDPATPRQIADNLVELVKTECAAKGLELPRLAVEPGRAIVGPAGVTLYTVGTVKPVVLGAGAQRVYVSVDGGMSDNIRTALYDSDYTIVVGSRTSDALPMLARVVGKHCEAGDVVVRDAYLPSDVGPDDILALAATGAYCRSMASNYNFLPRPAVVAVSDGASRVIVRGETADDLLRSVMV